MTYYIKEFILGKEVDLFIYFFSIFNVETVEPVSSPRLSKKQ